MPGQHHAERVQLYFKAGLESCFFVCSQKVSELTVFRIPQIDHGESFGMVRGHACNLEFVSCHTHSAKVYFVGDCFQI